MTPQNAVKGRKGFVSIPVAQRIESRISRIPFSGCWIWEGGTNSYGYGQTWLDGKHRLVHVFLYEQKFGPKPAGKELNHLCKVRWCVNPEHLEPVTHSENMRYSMQPWGYRKPQTHCKNGHLMAGYNLAYGGNHRYCRSCRNQWAKDRRAALAQTKVEPQS